MNLNIFKELDKKECGEDRIVYIIKIQTAEGLQLYKIGVTTKNKHIDRLMEILKGYFNQYRYTPYAKLLRFRVFEDAFAIENRLHKHFKDSKYTFDKSFGGSTEFFEDIDEATLLELYDTIHTENQSNSKE